MATRSALTVHYGPHAGQVGDLYLPDAPQPPVVVLWHGGFWRMPYGRDQLDAIARALAERGYAAWNLEYRRIGAAGVSWRETLDDALAGVGHLAPLAGELGLDLGRVVLAGHSAGGHLALWAAAQEAHADVRVRGVIALAAVSDLVDAARLHLGDGAVQAFMGAPPERRPVEYARASPRALLPLRVPQLLLHGADDAAVPPAMSQAHVQAARAAGDEAQLRLLPETGHMEFLDPGHDAFAALCEALDRFTRREQAA